MTQVNRKGARAPSRVVFLLTLPGRGVLYSLAASAVAALLAHFVLGRGWAGTASALNPVGIVLWVLAASFA